VSPIEKFGVHFVSAGLLFGEEQHLSWPAELIGVLLNQLLWSTTWPDLDYLLIDMPPGTADVTQSVFQLLPTAKVVIVATPQEVAHLDARKLLSLLRSYRTDVLGGIENMAGVLCPCCGTTTDVFTPVAESRSIWSAGVEHLGKVPLDPPPAGLDAGVPVVVSRPDSAHATALRAVVQQVQTRLGDA
jgi:ATP-binding protein involved in chromosome partitioning